MIEVHVLEPYHILENIVVTWTEAKSPIYQRYVMSSIRFICIDVMEWMCLDPAFFVRWIQYCYKKGLTPAEAGMQIEKIALIKINK